MQQTGTYGAEFMTDVLTYVMTAAGTAFEMPPAAESVLSLLLLDGMQYMMRSSGGSGITVTTGWDWSSKSRSITRSYDSFNFAFWASVRVAQLCTSPLLPPPPHTHTL